MANQFNINRSGITIEGIPSIIVAGSVFIVVTGVVYIIAKNPKMAIAAAASCVKLVTGAKAI